MNNNLSQMRLRDFSVFISPPPGSVMAMLKGWIDDSRRNAVWAVWWSK